MGMDSTFPHDRNPIPTLGESVYFFHEPEDPCAAVIAKVPHPEGGPVDLVVYCLGKPKATRPTWARGHSVVVFKGEIPHVTAWAAEKKHRPSHFWSRSLRDLEEASRAS